MQNRDRNRDEGEAARRITIIEKWLRRLESMIIRPTGSGTLHDAVTVTDTATINLTLVGQNIQADLLGGGAGDMTKAVYDIDNDGIVDKSETIDDGAGSAATAADVKDAVTKKHTQGTDVALGAVGTKNPPIDADLALYRDSTASNALVTSTWTQIKAFLKTYFDTIYALVTHAAQHAVSGADTVFPADPGADRYLMWDDVPGELVWSNPAGSGDVVGPASATDGNLAVFDGVTGKLIKDGGAPGGGSTDGWTAGAGTWTPRSQAFTNDPAAGANIELEMADTSGFYVGDVVKVTSGTGSENALITVVHDNVHLTVAALYLDHNTTTPSVKLADTLYVERAYTNDPAAGNNIELSMASTAGFAVGDLVEVSSSAGREKASVTVVHVDTHLTVNTLALNHTTTAPMVKQVVQWTFIMDTSADYSATLAVGQRIKFTDTTVKYFLLHAISTTRLTLFGGTDYSVVSTAAVTSPSYSNVKAPYGFPLSTEKWSVTYLDTAQRPTTGTTASTWYNFNLTTLSFPIGYWNIKYHAAIQVGKSANGVLDIFSTLSTANNSETDKIFTRYNYFANTGSNLMSGYIGNFWVDYVLSLSSKTTYYLNCETTQASTTTMQTRGDVSTTIVRVISAYL